LLVFLCGVLVTGGLIGALTQTGSWYEGLSKPVFNPPNWVFGPVWSILYVMIAIAGWRVFQTQPRGSGWGFWCGQMVLNFAWTPLFFTLHLLWSAAALLAVLLALIVLFIAGTWRRDRVSAWLFVPYALWVGFAGLLNVTIAVLN